MKRIIRFTIKLAEQIISPVYLKFFKEKNSLIICCFHRLFRDEEDIKLNIVDPQEGTTIQHFRQFIEYFLDHNYTFICPKDILNALDNDKKYIMITFDDGYFNNQYALSTIKEYSVPATFFISTNNVKYNKCFWWDVLYRKRIKRGVSARDILREHEKLKIKTSKEIEKYLIDIFGKLAFKPICDIDRPFSPSELRKFSKEKYVFLGNHTSDHEMLTNRPPNRIRQQLLTAQNTIFDIVGIKPIIIAYPHGNYSNEVIKISKDIGLQLGVTAYPKRNYLPINFWDNSCMCLGRFMLLGNRRLIKQCEMYRSDIELYNMIRSLFKK